MANLIEQLDAKIAEVVSGWNLYTSVIAFGLFAFVAYSLFMIEDPDTHPILLLRQSIAAPVRQPGESAVYRSHEVPHGYPLKTGLQVKPPGTPAYYGGKDGDLRDIWRRVTGELPLEQPLGRPQSETPPSTQLGKILTVVGTERVIEHDIGGLTKGMNVIGSMLQEQGARRVAVYLPNSVELLSTVFAGAFYGFSVVLLPFSQPHETISDLLRRTNADCLVAHAGSVPIAYIGRATGLRQVIWVAEGAGKHMDWTGEPDEIGADIQLAEWHELVQRASSASTDLPPDVAGREPGTVITIWQGKPGTQEEIVEFTQKNLVSAIAAQISALSPRQRLTPSDLFLPAVSLTDSHALTLTLAALFTRSSLAINSVAGPSVSLPLATRSIAPTVILASAETAAALHAATAATATGSLKKLAHYMASRALEAGRMPVDGLLSRLNAPVRAAMGATPGKLRLLIVAERAGAGGTPLSSAMLSDLRVYTGARVVYALTAPRVAGAVAQTSVFDYRREGRSGHGHFGVPLGCVEVKLVDVKGHRTTEEGNPEGEIVVEGPAVAGGKARLGVTGTFREDGTLAYV